MRSLLTALQDGRLVELPDNNKEKSLRYLAHLIEAIPELGGHLQVDEEVLIREQQGNTGIGLGVACPHTRASGEGGLWCAVGWNPAGIDYGSPDGQKVHLVVMYYVPDSQKVAYLKEVSSLASAIKKEGGIQAISGAQDIAGVRNSLLDWVSTAIEAGMPEARARMVRLEARQAAARAGRFLHTRAQAHWCRWEIQRTRLIRRVSTWMTWLLIRLLRQAQRRRVWWLTGHRRWIWRACISWATQTRRA